MHEVVVRAGEVEDGARFGQRPDPVHERTDQLPPVRAHLHREQGLETAPQLRRVQFEAVPEDHPGPPQPGHPVQTR